MKLVYLFVFCFLILSCESTEDQMRLESCDNGTCNNEVFKNASLTISQANPTAEIAAGDKLVFRRIYTRNDAEYIADDEMVETIFFEIEKGSTSFTLTNFELSLAKAYISRQCFCIDKGYIPINKGTISGEELIPGLWEVTFNISVNDYYNSGEFTALYYEN